RIARAGLHDQARCGARRCSGGHSTVWTDEPGTSGSPRRRHPTSGTIALHSARPGTVLTDRTSGCRSTGRVARPDTLLADLARPASLDIGLAGPHTRVGGFSMRRCALVLVLLALAACKRGGNAPAQAPGASLPLLADGGIDLLGQGAVTVPEIDLPS